MTMQELCTICLIGHFRGDLFSQISFSRENRENKSIAKIIDLQYFTFVNYLNI